MTSIWDGNLTTWLLSYAMPVRGHVFFSPMQQVEIGFCIFKILFHHIKNKKVQENKIYTFKLSLKLSFIFLYFYSHFIYPMISTKPNLTYKQQDCLHVVSVCMSK